MRDNSHHSTIKSRLIVNYGTDEELHGEEGERKIHQINWERLCERLNGGQHTKHTAGEDEYRNEWQRSPNEWD